MCKGVSHGKGNKQESVHQNQPNKLFSESQCLIANKLAFLDAASMIYDL